MKQTAIATVLLISFLVVCLLVDDSDSVVGILGRQRFKTVEKPDVDQSSGERAEQASQKHQGRVNLGSFPQRKPDRFPEGPMFDKRSRTRFYNY